MTSIEQEHWFSLTELAAMALPTLPATERNMRERCNAEGWLNPELKGQTWRERSAQGGGYEFTMYSLPLPAQAALVMRIQAADLAAQKPDEDRTRREREDLWWRFDAMPEKRKAEARRAYQILDAVEMLIQNGVRKNYAIIQIAALRGVGTTTIYNWYRDVRGLNRCDWLAALAPHYATAKPRTKCPREAWDILKADYLRLSSPTFNDCYRRLQGQAKKEGWQLPSAKTLKRRMDALGPALLTLCREGSDALRRMFPAQERDRSIFHAMEAVNVDGHVFDVFVDYPGIQKPIRPVLVAFQDLFTGMILSWRLDVSENKEMVRLAFGDMVERYGIPHKCYLDNGRAFASKWLTGGVENRYRFKLKDDEPQGIMPQLGVDVRFVNPYSGQSKPIERAWRDLAQGLAKHPLFEGAYAGNNPMNKPENYGSRSVSLEVFIKVVAEGIREHNERIGRRSKVCGGKLSFRQAFEASYATAPITKATPEQRRLWLLAAEAIRADRTTGEFKLEGNRFWTEELTALRGQQLVVRFDPQALQNSVFVYRLDGTFVCEAPCLAAAGFADKGAAQSHNRARKAWERAQKDMKAAEVRMSLAQLQEVYAVPEDVEEPDLIEARVVRPLPRKPAVVTGNVAIALEPDDEEEDWLIEANRQARPERQHLRIVDTEE